RPNFGSHDSNSSSACSITRRLSTPRHWYIRIVPRLYGSHPRRPTACRAIVTGRTIHLVWPRLVPPIAIDANHLSHEALRNMSQADSIDFQPTQPVETDIESTVAGYIERAVDMRASDLFFMSNENHVGVWVRYLGSMVEIARVSAPDGRRCMNHIKAMA